MIDVHERHPSAYPVFILAGGQGERLAPLTEAKPKPVVSFAGTHQIIDFTLSNCLNSEFRKIYVLTQYQREPLHDYVRQARLRLSNHFRGNDGHELRCSPPASGKHYRGTADAVFQNLPLVRFDSAEHIVITSGDHIYAMDYRQLLAHHIAAGAEMTMAAVRRPVREASDFGVVNVANNGTVVGFTEKPCVSTLPAAGEVLVNMGVYAFRRSALLDLAGRANPAETDFGQHIIPKLIRSQRVSVYDFDRDQRNYWRDVGSLDSYYAASMDLVGSNPAFDPEHDPSWPIFTLAQAGRSVLTPGDSRISRSATVKGSTIRRSVISQGACIEPGAIVQDSVILPGARIGRNAQVRNTILVEGASIASGSRIGENLPLDRSRFLVTPGGVVVVSASINNLYERSAFYDRRTLSETLAAPK